MEKRALFKAPKNHENVYNTMLLVLGISKEDFAVSFNPCEPSMMVFGVHCNRVFNFLVDPYYELLPWFMIIEA